MHNLNLALHFNLSDLKISKKSLLVATRRSIREVSPSAIPTSCEVWIRESGYPTTEEIKGFKDFRKQSRMNIQSIVAIGGGSTIDAAKAISSVCFQETDIQRISFIPTNIGSGAEVTSFATLWNFAARRKISINVRDDLKRAVYYNFSSFSTVSRNDALIGALDALAHSYDSLFSVVADEGSKRMAVEAIVELNDLLLSGFESWPVESVVTRFHNAAMLAAFCIEKTRTSLSHGLSYGLTLNLGIPHGIAVALTLREYLETYSTLLTTVVEYEVILCSVNAISNILSELLPRPVGYNSQTQIEESIDWSRVENFAPVRSKQSHLALLQAACSRIP